MSKYLRELQAKAIETGLNHGFHTPHGAGCIDFSEARVKLLPELQYHDHLGTGGGAFLLAERLAPWGLPHDNLKPPVSKRLLDLVGHNLEVVCFAQVSLRGKHCGLQGMFCAAAYWGISDEDLVGRTPEVIVRGFNAFYPPTSLWLFWVGSLRNKSTKWPE